MDYQRNIPACHKYDTETMRKPSPSGAVPNGEKKCLRESQMLSDTSLLSNNLYSDVLFLCTLI